jgi:hypothetical protein
MKTNNNFVRRIGLALAAGTLLASTSVTLAGSASPVGPVWDVVISGKANGVAYLSFLPTGELCGVEIITPKSSGGTVVPENERYLGPETGRNSGDAPATNALSSTNVLYGAYVDIKGWWTYDTSGRIVGGFPEIGTREQLTTTEVTFTNEFGQVITNQVTATAENAVTNNVSFVGKVSSSGKLSMTGHSGIGKVNYRGVVLNTVPDLGGPWLIDTKRNGQQFYEFMRLEPNYTPGYCSMPYYWVCGQGPSYYFTGIALASTQKRLALATSRVGTSETIARAVSGSVNYTKKTATLNGGEDPQLRVKLKVSALLYGAPPLPCDGDNNE